MYYGMATSAQRETLDMAIIKWMRKGYQVVSRTPTSAHLYRPKRFGRWGYWTIIFFVLGLLLYASLSALIRQERHVKITADLDGYVVAEEQSAVPISTAAGVFGIVGLVAFAILLALIVVAGMNGAKSTSKQLTVGVHVCSDSNFSSFSNLCLRDDTTLTVSQVASGHFVAGFGLGSSQRMDTLNVQVSGAGTGVAVLNTVSGNAAVYLYGHLSNWFKYANLSVVPGAYVFTVQGGTPTNYQLLGTYTLTIVP